MKIDTDNNLIIPGSLEISDLKAIKVVGELNKVEDFLQGQLTSDISLLNNGASQLSCICDHKGQVIADFIVLKQDNDFFIIIEIKSLIWLNERCLFDEKRFKSRV